MDWLNLHHSVLDSPEVIGADPVERGTWLMLLRYCIGQENSGIIKNCRTWPDRKWQQIARVTQAETQATSDLWTWEGDDLRVTHYPLDKEAIVKGGRLGGSKKTQAKTQAARQNGLKGGRPQNPSQSKPQPQGKTQQKGREGKGTGMENTPRASAAVSVPDIVSLYPRREDLEAACQAVEKHIRQGEDPEAIRAGTAAIAAIIPRLPSAHLNRFVPSAGRFFRDKRWQDDPETWLRAGANRNGHVPTGELDLGGRRPAETIKLSTH